MAAQADSASLLIRTVILRCSVVPAIATGLLSPLLVSSSSWQVERRRLSPPFGQVQGIVKHSAARQADQQYQWKQQQADSTHHIAPLAGLPVEA